MSSGHAYEKLKSVYFNIGRSSEYGKLSGVDLDKIQLGATVDLDSYEKEDPRDFTLLKRSTLAEIKRGVAYKTDLGQRAPGLAHRVRRDGACRCWATRPTSTWAAWT